jgi:hypothetical protein
MPLRPRDVHGGQIVRLAVAAGPPGLGDGWEVVRGVVPREIATDGLASEAVARDGVGKLTRTRDPHFVPGVAQRECVGQQRVQVPVARLCRE